MLGSNLELAKLEVLVMEDSMQELVKPEANSKQEEQVTEDLVKKLHLYYFWVE